MSFKIKGRDNNYYDIFDNYFAGGSTAFTINNYRINGNNKTIYGSTTNSNVKYVATTQNTFKNGSNDIFYNGSYLIAKYDIITTVGTTTKNIDNRYNRIIVVGISGGGGGEAGTYYRGGSGGGNGGVFAFETSNVPSSINVTVGGGGGGGGGSGGNGANGGETKISWGNSYVAVSGGSGGPGTSTGTVSSSNSNGSVYTIGKSDTNWLVETNTSYGNAGVGGSAKRGGSPGQQGAVYIYYFHK